VLSDEEAIDAVGDLTSALQHPGAIRLDITPVISTRRVANSITNITANRVSPLQVHTSTVKKSAAASTSQCVFKNSCQVVRRWRSGAGSIPCCLRMFAIVPRAT
jgi:hypothetical protein